MPPNTTLQWFVIIDDFDNVDDVTMTVTMIMMPLIEKKKLPLALLAVFQVNPQTVPNQWVWVFCLSLSAPEFAEEAACKCELAPGAREIAVGILSMQKEIVLRK